jgi:TonB-linked SusC/RagA family outer membrane protein
MYKFYNAFLCKRDSYILFKFLLIMKLTFALLVVCLLHVSAATYSQNINMKVKNASLLDVFKKLHKQSGVEFVYDNKMLDEAKHVSINAVNTPLTKVLDDCFEGQPLSYEIIQNLIIVKKKTAKDNQVPAADKRLPIVITGKVTDEKGQTIPGVTIKLKDGSISTSTKADGSYSIKIPDGNATLVFTFIGYATQEIPVNNTKEINVTLIELVTGLNDVVVVAYSQKQRKIETLGAQSVLNVNELKQPVANITTVLAGRISGLVGVQQSAEPGRDGANLWIRGISTLGSSSNSYPLILVDGVERTINNIDPNDIESFSILKDASSTSVYGVRGANGVILVTTKRGKAGRTNINIDYNQGVTQFTRVPQIADGVTYLKLANEASITRGGPAIYTQDRIDKTISQADPYLYPNVNWFNEIFNKTGQNKKANLNISGGSDKMTYYVSAGYYDETGLFKTSGLSQYNSAIKFSRYNFTSSLVIKATKSTTIDLGIKGWIANGNYPGSTTNAIFNSVFLVYPTLYPVSYPNGIEPFTSTGGGLNSPYGLLTNRGYVTTYNNQLNSDIRVNQDLGSLVEGLSARVLYSFDGNNDNTLSRLKSPTTTYARSRDAQGNLVYDNNGLGSDYLNFSKASGGGRQFYLESAINYKNTFGKHSVSGLILYNQNDRLNTSATDLIGSLPYRSLGAVGRATYSYNDRYFAELSFGYNGAENFAPKSRFGFFPSAAVGWVLSNEKFFGNMKNVFQLLKFRGSYGLVGNSTIDGRRFAYISTININTGAYYYGQDRGNGITGIDIQDYGVDVTWETSKDLNIGLDLRSFNDALFIQLDVFSRQRTNIFLQRASVPASLGLRNGLLGNLGAANSSGIDLSMEFNKRIGVVDFGMRGTFTYNKNKVVENDEPVKPYPWLDKRGLLIGQRFGYIAEGFYTQAEIDNPAVPRTTGTVQAGDLKFKDLNGDGFIDSNDQTAIGLSAVPQIVYGFGTTVGYKGFSLGAFFQGVGRVNNYFGDANFIPYAYGSAKGSLYGNIDDRWTVENPSQTAFYPRLSYGAPNNQNYASNSHFTLDGTYLRLKTLDFGYTLPAGSLKMLGVQNMRIYFIGYNLITFSPFKYYDPEMGDGAGTRYPNIKTFSLGTSIKF